MPFSDSISQGVSDAFATCGGRRRWSVETQGRMTNQGRTTMKLTTIALAFAFALSSTLALAYTTHHYKHRHHGTTYRGTVGMGSGGYGPRYGGYGPQYGGSVVGTPQGGWTGPRDGVGNGLLGGGDPVPTGPKSKRRAEQSRIRPDSLAPRVRSLEGTTDD